MDKPNETPITYGIYVRKSSESEDKQVQSLVRQVSELKELIERDGLVIHPRTFEECQSAFRIGRPVFTELVDATRRGEINAWLCWHANRLSRNPVDGGLILHLMDEGLLDHVRTRDRIYSNTPQDKLMLHIEFGLSKNDSEEKSKIVRSGIMNRQRRGFPNGYPPVGFRLAGNSTSSGQSFWEIDKDQWKILGHVFQKFLQGNDSVLTLTTFAKNIGLRTIARRKLGGRAPSRSAIHRLLLNPVYAGFFLARNGKRYELAKKLPRLITEEEHDTIRTILGDHNLAKTRTSRPASFGGLIQDPDGKALGVDHKFHLVCDCDHRFCYLHKTNCPRCERKIELLKMPRYRSYIYYYSLSSKRRIGPICRSIEERMVRSLTSKHIKEHLVFPPRTKQWAIKYLHELQDEALRNRRRESEKQARFQGELKGKRRRLTELYMDGLIAKEDYEEEARALSLVGAIKQGPDFTLSVDWKAEAKHILELGEEFELILQHGNAQEVHQAIEALGITLIWDGSELTFRYSTRLRRLMALIAQGQATGFAKPRWPSYAVSKNSSSEQ